MQLHVASPVRVALSSLSSPLSCVERVTTLEVMVMRYAGTHVATVAEAHVGRAFMEVHMKFTGQGFGLVQKQDVGKMVMLHKDVIMLENNEQRDRRLARHLTVKL